MSAATMTGDAAPDAAPGSAGPRSLAAEPVEALSTGPDENHVIVTAGLTKVYPGGVTAVDGLDLTVGKGEIFALLGPNGAGKTTTVGILASRVVPTAGTALVNGIDVVKDPARGKVAVGVVSQANSLDRRLTVWENLYFHGRYFGLRNRVARAAADDLLERFRLTARATSSVASLSGGLAKRVMLARAFLPRPAVLFLDEPTAGLDPQSRLALWEILGQLHADGQTILLTTHYMEEADRLAQRVAIMDRGRLLALDTPEGLRGSSATGGMLVLKASGDLDHLARRVSAVAGVVSVTRAGDALRVALTDMDATVAEVLAVTNQEGMSLQRLSLEEASLETVFIGLTGKELRE